MKITLTKGSRELLTVYAFVFLSAVYVLYFILVYKTNLSLSQWDAENYKVIKDFGYPTGSPAFFPLFPFMWKVLYAHVYVISFVNLVLFILGFYYILKCFDSIDVYLVGLALSLSHFLYFMVPYTESLCFLGISMFLYFNKKEKIMWALLALFLTSLTRPLFTTLLITFLGHIVWDFLKKDNKISTKYVSYIFCILIATILHFSYLQYSTGNFWAFFEAQKEWHHEMRVPHLPLVLSNWYIGIYEVIALIIGFWSIFVLSITFFDVKITSSQIEIDLYAYLACMVCTMLAIQGGSLYSMNRYILCSPFFFYLIIQNHEILKDSKYMKAFAVLVILILLLCWQQFPEHLIFISAFIALNISAYYSYSIFKKKLIIALAIIANIAFQLTFFWNYVNGAWVA